jgi:uncharacterized protein YggL (DUF469 family)
MPVLTSPLVHSQAPTCLPVSQVHGKTFRTESNTLHYRFTADEFQKLCFDFGIELDKDTEDDSTRPKDQAPELAIEIPANRYDMLCFEGRSLRKKAAMSAGD